jgi:glycosyltransferase involved in cell wall biosynthesis
MVENPALLKEMGANGRKAVQSKYNWSFEESKLLKLYKNLC